MFTYILCTVILITSLFSIDFLFTNHFVLQCIEFSVSYFRFIFLFGSNVFCARVFCCIHFVIAISHVSAFVHEFNRMRPVLFQAVSDIFFFFFFFHTALNWDLWLTLKKKRRVHNTGKPKKMKKKTKEGGNCVGKIQNVDEGREQKQFAARRKHYRRKREKFQKGNLQKGVIRRK